MTTPSKTPRLFYFDDGVDAFVPVPPDADLETLRALVGFDSMDNRDECVIRFRRVDMTDGELEALPEV